MVHLQFKIQLPTEKKLFHGYSVLGIMHMMSSQPRLSMPGATGQNLLGTELRAGQSHALELFNMLVQAKLMILCAFSQTSEGRLFRFPLSHWQFQENASYSHPSFPLAFMPLSLCSAFPSFAGNFCDLFEFPLQIPSGFDSWQFFHLMPLFQPSCFSHHISAIKNFSVQFGMGANLSLSRVYG